MRKRDLWATRIGVILAMAGNAIGLGNFLRFPSQAVDNGGGAFMIPYFVCLLLLGIPLMWCEWAMGRFGGAHGHGTSPGMFDLLWKKPAAKYIGALGVLLPTIVGIYYVYVESWTLGYTWFAASGQLSQAATQPDGLKSFLQDYQLNGPWGVSGMAYAFFLATVLINAGVLYGGIAKGIERLAIVGMPLLFLLAFVLMVRVLTLGTPNPAQPDHNVLNGLGFMWNPDFSKLGEPKVWLAAAGQIFFTLSVGFGIMACYASYMRRRDDVVVTGLTTSMTNEVAEVVLGSSIAIPAAVAFFGLAATQQIVSGGMFNLGFVAMPGVFEHLPAGRIFATAWFFLLFIAGVTSSVALLQGAVTFLQDELGWTKRQAVSVVMLFVLAAAHIPVIGLKAGALDEMDFWAGTVGLALFALIEMVMFYWVFGGEKAWKELHEGAEVRIPRIFFFISKYVTPALLLVILGAWLAKDGPSKATMAGIPPEDRAWHWAARALILGSIALLVVLIRRGWRKHRGGAA